MRKLLLIVLAPCLLMFVIGCGGNATAPENAESVDVQQQNQDVESIKTALAPIAETGQVSHSGLYGLDESLKKAGKEDLVKELDKLGSTKNPEEAKKIAQGIIDKL